MEAITLIQYSLLRRPAFTSSMDFLSDLELWVLSLKVSQLVSGAYVNNVYSNDTGRYSVVLKDSQYSLNAMLEVGLWTSERYVKERTEDEFLKELRAFLEGSRIESIVPVKGDRVIVVRTNRGGVSFELFGKGNVICFDRDGTITCALTEVELRARAIKRGEKYLLPKQKGAPLLDIPELPYDEQAPLIKHVMYRVSIQKKLADEVLYRAGVDPLKPANSLSGDEKERISRAMREVVNEALSSNSLYVYGGDDLAYSIVELHNRPLLRKYDDLLAGVQHEFDALLFGEEKKEEDEEDKRIKLAQAYIERAKRIREVASSVFMGGDIKSAIEGAGGKYEGGYIYIDGRRIAAPSPQAAASGLYDLAKELELGAKNALASRPKPKERHGPRVREVIKREWFEKYRWFITSEGLLAVGGRDASSNIIILRRYMKSNDLVFHAELPGSPFFILPGSAGQASVIETAIATASFSRAWRLGLTASDVYYVRSDQVSFKAPSGEYLAGGAAMIYGEKNYIKGVKLQLGVGIAEVNGKAKVFCGPITAAAKHCEWYVEIEPGRLSQAEAAKKIRATISKNFGGSVPPLEDFQRALPAGGTNIVGLRRRRDISPV